MKIYIFSDLEGITGVERIGHVRKGMPEYPEGCRLMAGDINACVEGCFRAGATEVVVRDGHGAGCNVDPAAIDARAKLIQGATPGVRFAEFAGAAALILLGYHAKAGTPGAVLEHTFDSRGIQNLWLNGRKVGEAAIDAAIAAEQGVPVILVTGDDKLGAEVARDLPGVPFCQVKTSSGLEKSVSLPFAEARGRITAATADAVRRRGEIALPKIEYPMTIRIEAIERMQKEDRTGVAYPDPDDCRIYAKTGDSVEKTLFELL